MRSTMGGLLLFWLSFAPSSQGDVVIDWNNVLIEAQRADTDYPGPGWSSRNLAMMHAAIYDAVMAIDGRYQPYRSAIDASPGASLAAAAAEAAYGVAKAVYPQQPARFDAALAASLAAIPDGTGKQLGLLVGDQAAAGILAWRQNDRAHDPMPYTPGTLPGQWRPAPPIEHVPAWGPGWGLVSPFAIAHASDFRPPPPPSLDSAEYAYWYQEVKELGAVDSASRTAEETEIGIFWGYDRGGMGPPTILYNQIAQTIAAQQGNDVVDNARMFALINLAQADAGISCWEAKFQYNLWRPITAILEAATDGNPLTEADPNWRPLGAPGGRVVPDFTPPFPAYSSGHATFGAAAFRALARFYGRDDIAFVAASDELSGATRAFSSFSQASRENGRSRIYLGIHWDYDNQEGQKAGRAIGDYVFEHALKPKFNEPMLVRFMKSWKGQGDYDVDQDGRQTARDLFMLCKFWTGPGS